MSAIHIIFAVGTVLGLLGIWLDSPSLMGISIGMTFSVVFYICI